MKVADFCKKINSNMDPFTAILGGAGVLSGVASSIFGSRSQRKAAKAQAAELARQRAANEAWYKRNYYQDYLNTVNAQNALKRVRQAWADEVQKARGRQAVTGGTPEQAAAVAEAGGEAISNTIGNLAARGEQDKRAIDAQKQAMDAEVSAQAQQMHAQEQAAGANLLSNGIGVALSGAQALASGLSTPKETTTPTTTTTEIGAVPGNDAAVIAGRQAHGIGVEPETPVITAPKILTQREKNLIGLKTRINY